MNLAFNRNSNIWTLCEITHNLQSWHKGTLAAMRYGSSLQITRNPLTPKQFFTQLTKMIESKQQKGHGSVFLTQKRRTCSRKSLLTKTSI